MLISTDQWQPIFRQTLTYLKRNIMMLKFEDNGEWFSIGRANGIRVVWDVAAVWISVVADELAMGATGMRCTLLHTFAHPTAYMLTHCRLNNTHVHTILVKLMLAQKRFVCVLGMPFGLCIVVSCRLQSLSGSQESLLYTAERYITRNKTVALACLWWHLFVIAYSVSQIK